MLQPNKNTETKLRREAHFLEEPVIKTRTWFKEIEEMLNLQSEEDAKAMLLAVLHTLRDHMMIHEAVHLGAQLPVLIRGYYYEGWKPREKPERVKDLAQFMEDVALKIGTARLSKGPDAGKITEELFKYLGKKITPGEINDIKAGLIKEIADLLP